MIKKTVSEDDRLLIEKFLKKIPVFRTFSDDNLKAVMEGVTISSVTKGEDIVFQADEGTDLYIVLKGKVKVSLSGRDGNELVLTTLKTGDFFGEMSLIDGMSRSANVVAENETYLGVLRRDKFKRTMEKEPVIALDLLTALVDRLRKADDMIETLAFLDVNERLIKFLIDSARGESDELQNGFFRTKKRTHLDLASNIGSSRESVSKAMKVLAAKEYVTEKDGYFLVAPHLEEGF